MTKFYSRGTWRFDCVLMWLEMSGELRHDECIVPRAGIFDTPFNVYVGTSGMWVPDDLLRDFIPDPVAYAAFVNDDKEAFDVATSA